MDIFSGAGLLSKYYSRLISHEKLELSPVFSLVFANTSSHLFTSTEQGSISIQKDGDNNSQSFQAHNNCIFDLQISKDDAEIFSACGDETVKCFDIATLECKSTLKGHTGSVRSISIYDAFILASGSRDGNIMLWDLRCIAKSGGLPPVKTFGAAPKKKTVGGTSTITGVKFVRENTLLSIGTTDGYVKLWDLRNSKTPVHKTNPNTNSKMIHGFSSIATNSNSSLVYVTSLDSSIYEMETMFLKSLKTYTSPTFSVESFYCKSAVSPCDSMLISASSSGASFMWPLTARYNDKKQHVVKLMGHDREATSVSWSHFDSNCIATSADDMSVRIWKIERDFAALIGPTARNMSAGIGYSELISIENPSRIPDRDIAAENGLLTPECVIGRPICSFDDNIIINDPVNEAFRFTPASAKSRPALSIIHDGAINVSLPNQGSSNGYSNISTPIRSSSVKSKRTLTSNNSRQKGNRKKKTANRSVLEFFT